MDTLSDALSRFARDWLTAGSLVALVALAAAAAAALHRRAA